MVNLVPRALVQSLTVGKTIIKSLRNNKGMNLEDHVVRLTIGNCETLAKQGAQILIDGGVIGTPTDTIYGIAADAQNNKAVERIYEIKGRDFGKPIAICVAEIDQVYTWGKVTVPHSLLEDLLPGPVTLVFERFPALNPNLNPDINLIGIRIPNNQFIRNLAKFNQGPVALTSANRSSEPSTLTVEEFKPLWPCLQCVFDGGRLSEDDQSADAARSGSTVVDLSSVGHYRIIREGSHCSQCISILRDKYNLQEVVKKMSMLRRVLDRDCVVKANLVERLVDCVKELQLKYAAENGAALVNDEATNSLCWILEAVFIHGLKNRFIKTVSSILSSGRENNVPDPSFWHFVLIFCHQQDIMEIEKFSFIHTDIGKCRAWLRFSLNQGALISFLQMMISDKSTLKDYYKPTAFLRDAERFDILKSILYGIESYHFQLACNSSFLNAWNYVPLSLVGLHTPSHSQESISQGVDVAQNMNSKDLQALPQLRQGRTPPKPHGFPPNFEDHYRTPLLEEDAALRVILSSKHSNSSGVPSPSSSRRSSDATQPNRDQLTSVTHFKVSQYHQSQSHNKSHLTPSNTVNDKKSLPKENYFDSGIGSSSSVSSTTRDVQFQSEVPFTINIHKPPVISPVESATKKSKASHFNSENGSELTELSNRREESQQRPTPSAAVNIPSPDVSDESMSYAALFETYNKDKLTGTPIMNSFILENEDLINSSLAVSSYSLEENRSNTVTPVDQVVGFEVISNTSSSGHFSDMFPHINNFIQKIPNENGMDSQNYRCKSCSKDVGMIFQPARLCGLTGSYYCSDCHINDEFVIPSRIILNWDFNRYSVSKQAKDYLEEILYRPLFNVHDINPKLYDEVEECSEIQNLRTKLTSISIYLRTCKSVAVDFTKDSWPNEYLYENIHLYSLSDLLNIPNRTLTSNLKKLVTTGKSHITSCDFCAQKGFVCEICKNPKVIFPFDLDVIYKCASCGAVYHKECMNICKPCPRCIRWKKTEVDPICNEQENDL